MPRFRLPIYRTNKQGQFNVPLGTRLGMIPGQRHFRRCSIALRSATLTQHVLSWIVIDRRPWLNRRFWGWPTRLIPSPSSDFVNFPQYGVIGNFVRPDYKLRHRALPTEARG
jgi:hypothetical protein